MTDVAGEIRIADDRPKHRYEAILDDQVVGVSVYELIGDQIVFLHTEVDSGLEGMGVGSRLAKGALDDVRRRGLKVVARCPFIAAWLKRHPDYADLLADD
jgi:predicted GNAT family acetyltransferase